MANHITRKDINRYAENLYQIYAVPNSCCIDSIKEGMEKIGYNAGCFGWNWSAYQFHDKILIDGYRNFPRTANKYVHRIGEYNKLAREAFKNTYDRKKRKEIARSLLQIMFDEMEKQEQRFIEHPTIADQIIQEITKQTDSI